MLNHERGLKVEAGSIHQSLPRLKGDCKCFDAYFFGKVMEQCLLLCLEKRLAETLGGGRAVLSPERLNTVAGYSPYFVFICQVSSKD
jgi:hypothetical protein